MPIKQRKYAKIIQNECVACGCCMLSCPRQAIKIEKGMYAFVEETLCVGCSKCRTVCPASVITMEVRGAQ